jgi:hypothetical protein
MISLKLLNNSEREEYGTKLSLWLSLLAGERGKDQKKTTAGNSGPPPIFSLYENSVGILEQSMGARKQVEIRSSYRSARQHRRTESIPWNQFLGSLKLENTSTDI